jgi:hypothetical protein
MSFMGEWWLIEVFHDEFRASRIPGRASDLSPAMWAGAGGQGRMEE